MQLDDKYGFDRYYQIMLPGSKSTDIEYINHLLTQLSEEEIVEIAYPNAKPVVRDLSRPNTVKIAAKSDNIPDFHTIQYYLRSSETYAPGFKDGGINADYAWQYYGERGEDIIVVSQKVGVWDDKHVDLPPRALSAGYVNVDSHDTAAVGIIAAKDNGAGMVGIAHKATFGYAASYASVP